MAMARSTSSFSMAGAVSVVETIACRLPMKTRRPRSRLSARSSFSGLPRRWATLRAALSTRTASAASAPALRACWISPSIRDRAGVAVAPFPRRGALGFLAAVFAGRRGFGLAALGAGFLLGGGAFFAATFFRGAAFAAGRARLRAEVFRFTDFFFGGMARSLAGGVLRLVGAAVPKAQGRRSDVRFRARHATAVGRSPIRRHRWSSGHRWRHRAARP